MAAALLGGSSILVDQAAENLLTPDPGSDIDSSADLSRRFLLQALMRTVIVIVTAEFGQHLAEMPFAED
jgi:hypothetical protein